MAAWQTRAVIHMSLLDLARIGRGQSEADALAASVELARVAERSGHRRVWYAEHHNLPTVASSVPAVLIAHIAAHTSSIILGAGGVMLPNHAPLAIAEQYGMLATLHPGRIELGLGRAPGSDHTTMRAMRRDPSSADGFIDDVRELRGYLAGVSEVPGVRAIPGAGTAVPLIILGSSLYGAAAAASLGLPYAFASHFSPGALGQAVALYRERYQPSDDHPDPHVYAAMNVLCADDVESAERQFLAAARERVALLLGHRDFDDDTADAVLRSPQGQNLLHMMQYTAVGTPRHVAEQIKAFIAHADADEVVIAHSATTVDERLRSVELTAEAVDAALVSAGTN